MEKEKKNKRFKIAIILSVALVVTFIFLTSYAYWRISDHQTGSNYVAGGCLQIVFDEPGANGFSLTDAWPERDEDAIVREDNLYRFNVINTCEKPVNYQIVLESIEVPNPENKLKPEYVKLQLDNREIKTYKDLDPVTNDPDATDVYETRHMLSGTVQGRSNGVDGKVEHSVRLWMNYDAGLDARGGQFNSRVKIYAGQDIQEPEYALTPESCFTIDENGVLLSYNREECGTDSLVIPPTINGTLVTEIKWMFLGAAANRFSYIDISNLRGLNKIGGDAFYNGAGYVGTDHSLTIPNGVSEIGNRAFWAYNGTHLSLPTNMSSIGEYAFMEYEGINQDLIIPQGISVIEQFSFTHFDGKSLTLPESLTRINQMAFAWYRGVGTTLKIPDNVSVIETRAFEYFRGDELILPKSLESIDQIAFANYVGSGKEMVIPEGAISLGYGTFKRFNGISVTIPSTITSIGGSAFEAMDSTKTIYVNKPNLSGIELGENWNGNATVKCLVASNTYEVCS